MLSIDTFILVRRAVTVARLFGRAVAAGARAAANLKAIPSRGRAGLRVRPVMVFKFEKVTEIKNLSFSSLLRFCWAAAVTVLV